MEPNSVDRGGWVHQESGLRVINQEGHTACNSGDLVPVEIWPIISWGEYLVKA